MKYKLINFNNVKNKNKKEQNQNCPNISDNQYRILIIQGSGSGKTNALLNLINHEPDIDKMNLYTKGPYETKYQLLINNVKRQT